MKAMLLRSPRCMELIDLPVPVVRPGEVLIRVEACSICGSDLEAYHGLHPKVTYPRVLGHEFAGTVVEVGPGAPSALLGTRACCAAGSKPPCGDCATCRSGQPELCPNRASPGFSAHGAYAEYIAIPAEGALPIPEHLSFAEAALVQPLSISNHAVNRSDVRSGEWIAVLGAGPIGLGVLMIAKLRGARVMVTDVVDYRLETAARVGADVVVDSRRDDPITIARKVSDGKGLDRAIECVGSDQDETLRQAVEMIRPRGLVVVVGSFARNRATLPIVDFKFGEKELRGSQGAPEGFSTALDLVATGRVDVRPLVTHCLPLSAAEHALRLMEVKGDRVLKVVLEPHVAG